MVLRKAWEAFARGDVAAAIEVLDPEVQWYGAGDGAHEGGCHSRDEALAFIQQALEDGVTAAAFDVRDAATASSSWSRLTGRRNGASSLSRTARSSLSETARSSRWSSIRPSTRHLPQQHPTGE